MNPLWLNSSYVADSCLGHEISQGNQELRFVSGLLVDSNWKLAESEEDQAPGWSPETRWFPIPSYERGIKPARVILDNDFLLPPRPVASLRSSALEGRYFEHSHRVGFEDSFSPSLPVEIEISATKIA